MLERGMRTKDFRRKTDDGFSLCTKNAARCRPREVVRPRRWRQDNREVAGASGVTSQRQCDFAAAQTSGLLMRPDMAAGRYGDTRTWRKSFERALSSLAFIAFPGPDLTDHLTLPFVDLLTRLTFPKPRRLIVDQDAATTGTRKSSPFASMAQTERAILLASAIATSIFGLRASMRCSQLPSGAPRPHGRSERRTSRR